MTDEKDIQKLRLLLPHWIQHNADHGAEFQTWARRAGPACSYLEAAAQHCEEANFMLKQALARLGGPLADEVKHERPHTHHVHDGG